MNQSQVIKIKYCHVALWDLDISIIQDILDLGREGYHYCTEAYYIDKDSIEFVLSTDDLSGISQDDRTLIDKSNSDIMTEESIDRGITLSDGRTVYLSTDI